MCKQHLTINRVNKYDPTRTTGMRNRFSAAMRRRFKSLASDIRESIVDKDCFGIQKPTSGLASLDATQTRQFEFKTDPEKIKSFMDWLVEQEKAGVLQSYTRFTNVSHWTDQFVDAAYKQGVRRAMAEMQSSGMISESTSYTLTAAMAQPIHREALELMYSRTFEDLKTVTDVMNSQIRTRIADGIRGGLTKGLAEGKSPLQIARELVADVVNRVDVIGITRAELIARTEIIRAHHTASISEYRSIDEDMGVTVIAEFKTATDSLVCPDCASLDGKEFTLAEAEGLIPVHPNCRCVCLPKPQARDRRAA